MIYKLIILVASIFMIYEFTKSRSTAVAEIEPQLIDIIENIPTPSIAVAEIEPLMINTIADNKLEYQLIEKEFTKKLSTAVADIKPTFTDFIRANKIFVNGEFYNGVFIVKQKENLLTLETIFNNQESFKNWVKEIRQQEIEKLITILRDPSITVDKLNVLRANLTQQRQAASNHGVPKSLGIAGLEAMLLSPTVTGNTRAEANQVLNTLKEISNLANPIEPIKMLQDWEKKPLIILPTVDPLIIDFIQKHAIDFMIWQNANQNAWLKINGVA